MNNLIRTQNAIFSNSNYRRTSNSYYPAPFGPLSFLSTPFSALPPPPILMEDVPPIFSPVLHFLALFHGTWLTSLQLPGTWCSSVHVYEETFVPFCRMADYRSHFSLSIKQIILLQKACCFYETKKQVDRLCLALRNFMGNNLVALPAFSADQSQRYVRQITVCKGKSVSNLACFVSNDVI